MLVRSASSPRTAEPMPAMPKARPKNNPADQTDFPRNQLLRVNQDGGKGRGENDPDDHGENAGPEKVGVRERERKRRDTEDRNPDDQFASVTIADRSAEDRPERDGKEEKEQVQLCALDREMEFVDKVKGVVIR